MDHITSDNDVEFPFWESPGKRIYVRIRPALIALFEAEAMRAAEADVAGRQPGGVLLGRKTMLDDRPHLRVENAAALADGDRQGPELLLDEEGRREFEDTLRGLRAGPAKNISVIGFYRTHAGTTFELNEQDVSLLGTYPSDSLHLYLLLKHGSPSHLFFWQPGQSFWKLQSLQLPFSSQAARRDDRSNRGADEPAAASAPRRKVRPILFSLSTVLLIGEMLGDKPATLNAVDQSEMLGLPGETEVPLPAIKPVVAPKPKQAVPVVRPPPVAAAPLKASVTRRRTPRYVRQPASRRSATLYSERQGGAPKTSRWKRLGRKMSNMWPRRNQPQ